jgi:hypothetical protein
VLCQAAFRPAAGDWRHWHRAFYGTRCLVDQIDLVKHVFGSLSAQHSLLLSAAVLAKRRCRLPTLLLLNLPKLVSLDPTMTWKGCVSGCVLWMCCPLRT